VSGAPSTSEVSAAGGGRAGVSGAIRELTASVDDLRPGELWFVLRNALLELLQDEEGALEVARILAQADAETLSKYLQLLVWECENRECAWRAANLPPLPEVVMAEVLNALRETHSARARACLELCQRLRPLPPEALPVAMQVIEGPDTSNGRVFTAALDVVTQNPENLTSDQIDKLLAAGAEFGTPQGEALAFLGRIDPALSGPVILRGMMSSEPRARFNALQTVYYRYFPTERAPEPFEREFAMTATGLLLGSSGPTLGSSEKQWIALAATGMPTRELAYVVLDALAGAEEDASRRAQLADLAAAMVQGKDRGELQRQVSELSW